MISFEALRRFVSFAACLLVTTAVLPAQTDAPEWRTWVSPNGATIEAYLKNVQPDGIVIVRRDGQEFTVPLDRFSAADQAYVNEWLQEKKPATEDFRATDFRNASFPESHEITGVEQVRPASGEPPEAGAVKTVLNFHQITYAPSLGERLASRKEDSGVVIPTADLANALYGLPVETEAFNPPPLEQRETGRDADLTTLNAIRKAISLDLPVIIGHRPEIQEDTFEYVAVATGYDDRSLFVIEADGSAKPIPLDLRTLEESLIQALVIFPTTEAAGSPPPAATQEVNPEFLSRVSAVIREVSDQNAAALTELLNERGIAATVNDINRTDLSDQLGRTRSFAREGGIPQIEAVLNRGSVVIIPQEFEAGKGFALIYGRNTDSFSAVEFFPGGTFNRGPLADADLARRWVTRDDRTYRLDLIQITPPAPDSEGTPPPAN